MNKISPNLMVDDIKETVKFYKDVLGFELVMAVPSEQQQVMTELQEQIDYDYALVKKGNVEIMFQERNSLVGDIPGFSSSMALGGSMTLYFETDSIDSYFSKIKDKVSVVKGPLKTWYGRNEFYISDNNGYILGFSDNVTDTP